MRDCIFLVADSNMRACIEGFFERPAHGKRLGTAPFEFDPQHDLIVDEGGSDPGVHRRAHELLRSYRVTHARAVVILDNQWDGSPGATQIASDIRSNLIDTGWAAESIAVIVIDPELEVWIWQDSVHVERGMGHNGPASLRKWLTDQGLWSEDQAKPAKPKEAVECALRKARLPRSSSLYRDICSRVSVRSCADPSFQALRQALGSWFPPEAAT